MYVMTCLMYDDVTYDVSMYFLYQALFFININLCYFTIN